MSKPSAAILPLAARFEQPAANIPFIPAHSNQQHQPYVFYSAPADYGRMNAMHVAMFAGTAQAPALRADKQPILDADNKPLTRKVFAGAAVLQDPAKNIEGMEYTRVPVDRIGFAFGDVRHNMFNPLLVIMDEDVARSLTQAAHEFRIEYFRRNAVKGRVFETEMPAYAITPLMNMKDILARTMTVQADIDMHNHLTGQKRKLESERGPRNRGW